MKIGIAQISSQAGKIDQNIKTHLQWIDRAATHQTSLVVFPELSITGYEPTLAHELAMELSDHRLQVFSERAVKHTMWIAVGFALKGENKPKICMLICGPQGQIKSYSKMQLHADELPYFEEGNQPLSFDVEGNTVCPAICYESLRDDHAAIASALNCSIYMASVDKPSHGVEKAKMHYPVIAKRHNMWIMMANSVGPSDNFISAGQSGFWNNEGTAIECLDEQEEAVLIFDLQTRLCEKVQ